MATLFHWDLPQTLEDQGGWLNGTTSEHFKDYAAKCFEYLGDKVSFRASILAGWVSIHDVIF